MPFTPFHMGTGISIKALLQGSFSLMVFGWTQIVMDIQPLVVLITGEGHLHGFSHTYIGACLLAIFSALSGKYLSEIALKMVQRRPIHIAWWVSLLSAFVGSFSHVLLDSIMHADMEPFFPFSEINPILGIISIPALHKLCIYLGLFGAAAYFVIHIYLSKKHEQRNRKD
ncbi:metal-dependent hydrolase [Agarilytica rhodophyticola]|uniref:metal-dependent hydrolase n=1 Tax=Agarilytica rhodophyticola TaxID=1737490 RepID=UPI000B342A29|nr:metal-dependent hydrolase [Agarilytica rhodophyticola]